MPRRPPFRDFLDRFKRQASAEGDFAREVMADQTFPVVTSWPQLQHHLARSRAPADAMAAAERVWTEYENADE